MLTVINILRINNHFTIFAFSCTHALKIRKNTQLENIEKHYLHKVSGDLTNMATVDIKKPSDLETHGKPLARPGFQHALKIRKLTHVGNIKNH